MPKEEEEYERNGLTGRSYLNNLREARTTSRWLESQSRTNPSSYINGKVGALQAAKGAGEFHLVCVRGKPKERLRHVLLMGNVEKTMSSPVTIKVAYDLILIRRWESCSHRTLECAPVRQPSSLVEVGEAQIIAARRLFILCCARAGTRLWPMSGFDNATTRTREFATPRRRKDARRSFPDGHVKSNSGQSGIRRMEPKTFTRGCAAEFQEGVRCLAVRVVRARTNVRVLLLPDQDGFEGSRLFRGELQ